MRRKDTYLANDSICEIGLRRVKDLAEKKRREQITNNRAAYIAHLLIKLTAIC